MPMTKEEILNWARHIKHDEMDRTYRGYVAEIKELIKAYSGKNNSYYEELDGIPINSGFFILPKTQVVPILFLNYYFVPKKIV
jgi:hypothetical protein